VTERSESQTEDVATEEDAESQASVMDEEDRATADAESVDGKGELFPASERKELEQRWNDIQAGFVDQPRASVEEANALVSELMDRLVSSFSEQRGQLEAQWERGGDVTTEDLRVVLMRYRSFFGRLLEVPMDR
jgi:polyhydroxyalkanoate synthesis regulator phasin